MTCCSMVNIASVDCMERLILTIVAGVYSCTVVFKGAEKEPGIHCLCMFYHKDILPVANIRGSPHYNSYLSMHAHYRLYFVTNI